MCLDLKGGLPEGTIPRVTLAELATRGRYEFVSVLIPLEGRPPESVLLEVKPLLGSYGKAEAAGSDSTDTRLRYGRQSADHRTDRAENTNSSEAGDAPRR